MSETEVLNKGALRPQGFLAFYCNKHPDVPSFGGEKEKVKCRICGKEIEDILDHYDELHPLSTLMVRWGWVMDAVDKADMAVWDEKPWALDALAMIEQMEDGE